MRQLPPLCFCNSLNMYSVNDKNDKLTALKKAADEIFVPAATMKLALLGKVWGYDALYESCRVRIIADPLSHASSPMWKSPLLIAGTTSARVRSVTHLTWQSQALRRKCLPRCLHPP